MTDYAVGAAVEGVFATNDGVVVACHGVLRSFYLIVVSLDDGVLRAEDGVG